MERYQFILLYAIGYSAVVYILLLILRHVILYYIIKSFRKIVSSLPKFKSKKADATDREDELKRDQENEIFKQQVNEIQNRINKNKEGDAIPVEVQRTKQTTGGVDDAFAGTESRLEMAKETEVIVGYAKPVGKWTNLILGKKLSQIASIMQHQAQLSKQDGYWTAYTKARREVDGSSRNQVFRQ